jgi:predicted DNA-binding protein
MLHQVHQKECSMASVRLPEHLERKLAALATRTKRSKSFYVKEALEQYLATAERLPLSKKQRAALWLAENREAIEAHNRAIEKYGLPLKPLWEQDGAL